MDPEGMNLIDRKFRPEFFDHKFVIILDLRITALRN